MSFLTIRPRHGIHGAGQDLPVLKKDWAADEAPHGPRRPHYRSEPDDVRRRAEDEEPHPRWHELHILRPGQSDPRMNLCCPTPDRDVRAGPVQTSTDPCSSMARR